MIVELDGKRKELQESAIEFARGELGREMHDRDRDEVFDREGWKKCADFGVMQYRHSTPRSSPSSRSAVCNGCDWPVSQSVASVSDIM